MYQGGRQQRSPAPAAVGETQSPCFRRSKDSRQSPHPSSVFTSRSVFRPFQTLHSAPFAHTAPRRWCSAHHLVLQPRRVLVVWPDCQTVPKSWVSLSRLPREALLPHKPKPIPVTTADLLLVILHQHLHAQLPSSDSVLLKRYLLRKLPSVLEEGKAATPTRPLKVSRARPLYIESS